MKILYYTRTFFLDTAIPRAVALSKFNSVFFLLEVAPESYRSNFFDFDLKNYDSGIISGYNIFEKNWPSKACTVFKSFTNFDLFHYNHKRTLDIRTIRLNRRLYDYIVSINPDIIYVDEFSLRFALLIPNISYFPIVLSIHDAEPHEGEKDWRTSLSRWLSFKHIKHYIFHSDYSKEIFIKKRGLSDELCTNVRFGIFDLFQNWVGNYKKEEERNILFIGRISRYKGIEILFKSAEIISALISDCQFTIAGKCVPGYTLPERPKLLNGCSFNIIEKYLSISELADLIQRATFIVCPYSNATQSGVVLTAYAFNKPVVATNVGGLPEYVWQDQSGLLIPPNDPGKLADAIIFLLRNKHVRDDMKMFIQSELHKKLCWDESAKKLTEIFQKVIDESKQNGKK